MNCGEEEVSTKQASFAHLPPEIRASVANRLIFMDYMHFRLASKCCSSVAPPIKWRDSPRSQGHSLPPLLLFIEEDSILTVIDPRYGTKYHMSLPPSLSHCHIRYSKDGWLLMSRGIVCDILFNPFTKQTFKLLEFPDSHWDSSCICFTSSPTSGDCLAVQMCNGRPLRLNFGRPGDVDMRFGQLHCLTAEFSLNRSCPVYYKGAFYFLGEGGNLGVVRFLRGYIMWAVETMPQRPCSPRSKSFLVECGGKLLSVFVGFYGNWVRVFKFDHFAMNWVEVHSLEKYALYLSDSSSFSATPGIAEMENKIYFPGIGGQRIVFYSLDTRRFHTAEGKEATVDFHSTRKFLHCAWIEPRWF